MDFLHQPLSPILFGLPKQLHDLLHSLPVFQILYTHSCLVDSTRTLEHVLRGVNLTSAERARALLSKIGIHPIYFSNNPFDVSELSSSLVNIRYGVIL